MRCGLSFLILLLVTSEVGAQDPPKFRDLDEAIKFLEDRVVGRMPPAIDPQTLRALLDVVNLADKTLAQGQQQDPLPEVPVTSSPTGSFQTILVPRTIPGPGRRLGCFRNQIIYDRVCVWVDTTPSVPQKKYQSIELSKLRQNAARLNQRLIDKIATVDELTEIVRQVYSLAVMTREPFIPGQTHK